MSPILINLYGKWLVKGDIEDGSLQALGQHQHEEDKGQNSIQEEADSSDLKPGQKLLGTGNWKRMKENYY